MSLQRGNYKKKGPKYKNTTAYKNDLYDKSPLTKALNSMVISEVCGRCTDKIQWRIKYKKYKPLTQPKRCTKCQQKTVKKAYLVICSKCAGDKVCAKCGEKAGIVNQATLSPSELASQRSKQEAELKLMSERERRAFYRKQSRSKQEGGDAESDDGDDSEDKQSGEDNQNGVHHQTSISDEEPTVPEKEASIKPSNQTIPNEEVASVDDDGDNSEGEGNCDGGMGDHQRPVPGYSGGGNEETPISEDGESGKPFNQSMPSKGVASVNDD